jgi:hypothetical protein
LSADKTVIPVRAPAESILSSRRLYGFTHHIGSEGEMTGIKQTHNKDRLKDRSDIGEVKSQIEKLMEFRDARASCVHIEAAMDADRDLTDTRKKHPN